MTRFGFILRKIRHARGQLLYEMAKVLNMRSSLLSSYERDVTPDKDWVEHLISCYDLTEKEINLLWLAWEACSSATLIESSSDSEDASNQLSSYRDRPIIAVLKDMGKKQI